MDSAKQIPIRVALFTGAYNHIADGVSLTLNRLVGYLENNGFEVLVFAPSTDMPALNHAGTLVEVPSVSAPGRPDYRVATGVWNKTRRRLIEFDPAIIHIATPDFLGLSALRFARKNGVPTVASYHTHFSSYLKYYKLGLFEGGLWSYLRWFYGNCQQIYVPSASMSDVLRSHGISGGLLDWPRGVETDRFSPDNRNVEWRRSLGFEDDDVVVSFVGRLVWEKGLDVFTNVIDLLRTRNISVKSLIVGKGPAKAELMQRLPDGVFAGHLQGEKLNTAYASADIFLFPSETETFGNVTLEAMASGLPAVCADATGSNAIVIDGKTGFLVAPKNISGFADRIEQLVVDTQLRDTMSIAARETATEFAWDSVLARIPRYYNELLAATTSENPIEQDEYKNAPSTDSAVAVH